MRAFLWLNSAFDMILTSPCDTISVADSGCVGGEREGEGAQGHMGPQGKRQQGRYGLFLLRTATPCMYAEWSSLEAAAQLTG